MQSTTTEESAEEEPKPQLSFCENCKKEIASANFLIHEIHCSRHIVLCPKCEEPVPRSELDQHLDEEHSDVCCPDCNLKLEKQYLEEHQTESCTKRKVQCQFCELSLAFCDLREHENVCGCRTEKCTACGLFVMKKDARYHEETDCRVLNAKKQLVATIPPNCKVQPSANLESIPSYSMISTGAIGFVPNPSATTNFKDSPIDSGVVYNKSNDNPHVGKRNRSEVELNDASKVTGIVQNNLKDHDKRLVEQIDANEDCVPCKYCEEMFTRACINKHQDETCIKQRVPCEYCELPVPLSGFEEHEKFCASRTEECPTCRNRIMIRYFHDHLLDCNAGTQPFPNLRDLHRCDRSKYDDDDDLLTDGSAVLPIQPHELLQRGHQKERLLDDGAGVYDHRFGDLYEGDDWKETNGEEEILLPCEFCKKIFRHTQLFDHQSRCRSRPFYDSTLLKRTNKSLDMSVQQSGEEFVDPTVLKKTNFDYDGAYMSEEEEWGGTAIAHPDDKYLSRLAKESSVGEKNTDKNRVDNARQKDKLSGSFSVGDAAKLKRTDSFPKSLSAEFRPDLKVVEQDIAAGQSEGNENESVIPCEFCGELFPIGQILHHQELVCEMRATNHFLPHSPGAYMYGSNNSKIEYHRSAQELAPANEDPEDKGLASSHSYSTGKEFNTGRVKKEIMYGTKRAGTGFVNPRRQDRGYDDVNSQDAAPVQTTRGSRGNSGFEDPKRDGNNHATVRPVNVDADEDQEGPRYQNLKPDTSRRNVDASDRRGGFANVRGSDRGYGHTRNTNPKSLEQTNHMEEVSWEETSSPWGNFYSANNRRTLGQNSQSFRPPRLTDSADRNHRFNEPHTSRTKKEPSFDRQPDGISYQWSGSNDLFGSNSFGSNSRNGRPGRTSGGRGRQNNRGYYQQKNYRPLQHKHPVNDTQDEPWE